LFTTSIQHFAKQHSAKRLKTEYFAFMQSAVMLSVASKTTMLSVALPNAIMLNVELPSKTGLIIDQV